MSLIFHFREGGRVLHFPPRILRQRVSTADVLRREFAGPSLYLPRFSDNAVLIAKNYAILVNFGHCDEFFVTATNDAIYREGMKDFYTDLGSECNW